MTTPRPVLTEDEAVQLFFGYLKEQWGDDPSGKSEPENTVEAEARYFRCAEEVLRLVCPDPRWCTHQHCRRMRLCRHFADLRERERCGRSHHPRRTPGAAALRHAIWLYMNGNVGDER